MKLSEAIRRGCELTPPNDGKSFLCDGTCAVGAAYTALGLQGCVPDAVMKHYGISFADWHRTLQLSFKYSDGWTREQIADWVEREYESKLPQKVRESDDAYTKRVLAEIVNGQWAVKESA